jgi:uncharacterized protein YdaU (DUF1376 family)
VKRHIPYFSFYPADFMNGVRGLNATEVGVYMMLLCRIYEENGPVEYHVRRLATYCGMREQTFLKSVQSLIDLGKLTVAAGMLSNPRAEAEIAKRARDLENNSKAGKASAEKRQGKQGRGATDVQQPFNHTDTDTDTDKEQQPREAVSDASMPDQTHRERLLSAMGADPISGLIGPNGRRLGTVADTEEAAKWTAMGLTIDKQCAVIAERCAAMRGKNPTWTPGRFAYFTGAMADLAAAKAAPIPTGTAKAQPDDRAAKMARYDKIARQA